MSIWQETLPDNSCIVGARGRLDQNLNPQLAATLNDLLEEGHSQIIVDLSEATYINSGGLRALVGALRRARQQGGELVVCGLNPRLQEIFTLVGFDQVFRIIEDCADARRAFEA